MSDISLVLAQAGADGAAVLHVFDGGSFQRTLTGRPDLLKRHASQFYPGIPIEEAFSPGNAQPKIPQPAILTNG